MKYTHYFLAMLLGLFMTTFATAQSHTHRHSKMRMKADTSLVKEVDQKMIKEKYTCSMHSEVVSDKPGKCPKCGMTLVKVKSSPIVKKYHKMQKDTLMSHPNKLH